MNRNSPRLDFNEVKDAARGRWIEILSTLAPQISEALENPGRKKITCPLHGGRSDFRLFKKSTETGEAICTCKAWSNGVDLLMDLNNWDVKTCMTEIANVLWGAQGVVAQPRRPEPKGNSERKNRALMEKSYNTWMETVPLLAPEADPALQYLARRGIHWETLEGMEHYLRFHPELPYWVPAKGDKYECVGEYPAIVARFVNADDESVTLHRIYLDADSLYTGKAMDKKMRAYPDTLTLHGGAIRLGEPAPMIGVAEGVENALAAREATGLSVWPCFANTLLETFIPPEPVKGLVIFGDRDLNHAGESSAMTLVENLKSYEITPKVFIPGRPGDKLDWNDVLTTKGLSGFDHINDYLDQCRQAYMEAMQEVRKKQHEPQPQPEEEVEMAYT